MVDARTVTLTYLLHQPGYEEIHRSHQLQREDLQHFHTVWKVYFLWQWGRAGVRVEYRHRWGWRRWFESISSCELTPVFVQVMQSRSTLSSVILLLSMVWHSTLMRTWLPSVPLAITSLSTHTCTTTKVCSKSPSYFSHVKPGSFIFHLLYHSVPAGDSWYKRSISYNEISLWRLQDRQSVTGNVCCFSPGSVCPNDKAGFENEVC